MPAKVKQLSVTLPSFVWDYWGGHHWLPVNIVEYHPPDCNIPLQQSGLKVLVDVRSLLKIVGPEFDETEDVYIGI